jgi:hypothetical protein
MCVSSAFETIGITHVEGGRQVLVLCFVCKRNGKIDGAHLIPFFMWREADFYLSNMRAAGAASGKSPIRVLHQL